MCITVLQTIKESEDKKAPEAAMDIEMFKRDLLPHLLSLVEDRVANIRQRAGISLQLLKEIKGFKNDAKVAAALAALTKDKDVEVLRSMGQKLQVGLTSCKHLGGLNPTPKPNPEPLNLSLFALDNGLLMSITPGMRRRTV
jgi:hypothetical protein